MGFVQGVVHPENFWSVCALPYFAYATVLVLLNLNQEAGRKRVAVLLDLTYFAVLQVIFEFAPGNAPAAAGDCSGSLSMEALVNCTPAL